MNIDQEGQTITLKEPNTNIFSEYGSLTDPDSTLSKCQFLLVRHGLSVFNKAALELREELAVTDLSDGEKLMKEIDVFSDHRGRPEMVDAQLHESGVQQALDQQELLNHFTFVKVLVSPHRRTIQTALNILKSHPQIGNMTFVLYPMAKEILNNANDLPISRSELLTFIGDIKTQYPGLQFDLSLMDNTEDENLWFIKQLENEEVKNELLESIKDKSDIEEIYDAVMIKYKQGKGVEGNRYIYERIQKLKIMLKNELNETLLAELAKSTRHKVLVVTHSRVLQCFSASGVDIGTNDSQGGGKLIGSRYYNNCEVVPFQA